MVFTATFNNISVISWQSVLLVKETGENHQPVSQVTDKLYHIMLYLLHLTNLFRKFWRNIQIVHITLSNLKVALNIFFQIKLLNIILDR